MRLLKSQYSVHPKNYHKRSPEQLKRLADLGLLIAGICELAPEFPGKDWVVFVGIAFKLITKFIADETLITPRP